MGTTSSILGVNIWEPDVFAFLDETCRGKPAGDAYGAPGVILLPG